MSGLLSILAFVLILIILIVLHEMGHMIVAKLSGMRVERFSVFMGKPVWSFRRGETEYGLGWLPIGGYVKITGMTREELVKKEYDPQTGAVISETPEAPEIQARAYCNSTTPRKVATILAGPVANLIVAVLAFAISFWIGLPHFEPSNVVSAIRDKSPAATAGLLPGDRILRVNAVVANGDDPTPLGKELERNVGKPVVLQIDRKGAIRQLSTPPLIPDTSDPNKGRLGINFDPSGRRLADDQFGFATGLAKGVDFSVFVTTEQVKALGRLFVDKQARSEAQGIIGIGAVYKNEVAGTGWSRIFRFAGLISMVLAVMNLLPLMPLDGGHIVFALFERVRRKRLNSAAYQRASLVGIALIVVAFFYVTKTDIGNLTGAGYKP